MIRQAHTYLVGALSGVVVIGIAIAAFVVLVSAQVFHDLPIPALSSSDQKAAAVSQAKALTSPDRQAVATTGGISTGTIQLNHTTANANAAGGGQPGAAKAQPRAHHQATAATPTGDATGPAEVVESAPSTSTETGNSGSPSGGGSTGGSHSSQPSSNSQPSSGNSGGGNTNSTSGSSGTSGANSGTPTPTSGSGGSATGTSGGGSSSTSPPATPVTTAKPSEAVTEAVNGTVGTVDEAVGGTLGETGATHVTEEVVNGVAGPESVVGKTVDGVGEVVGGLLGGHGE
jgi:hypothetical protein